LAIKTIIQVTTLKKSQNREAKRIKRKRGKEYQ
jgi:hypothetical protein